jgi:hypothetical protein
MRISEDLYDGKPIYKRADFYASEGIEDQERLDNTISLDAQIQEDGLERSYQVASRSNVDGCQCVPTDQERLPGRNEIHLAMFRPALRNARATRDVRH